MGAPCHSGTVRIYRRGRTYWMQWRGRRSLHTGDRKLAEGLALDYQRRTLDPNYRPPDTTATLASAFDTWTDVQKQRGRAEGTLKQYDVHAAHLGRVLGAHAPLVTIDAAAIDRYLATRHKEGASTSTQWKELCSLRGTLKLARRHKLYPFALDEVMPVGFEGAQSKPGTRHLLMPDVMKLIAALPDERAAVVRFIVATAADWVGVERAEASDIDRKGGTVRVHGSKTDFRDRTVPILAVFAPLLEGVSPPFVPWINVRRDLAVACKRAKVEKVTPRDLRRSHSRILRAAGVEPSLIASMLGHADERMVRKVYGRIEPHELGAVIERRLAGAGTKSVRKPRPKKRKQRKNKRAA